MLGGTVMGLLSAALRQKYHRTKPVDWPGFFNGRRLVPIIMAFVGTALGVLLGLTWGPVATCLTHAGDRLTGFFQQQVGSLTDTTGQLWHGGRNAARRCWARWPRSP